MSEWKCLDRLEIMGSPGTEYREWNEKLLNVMAQIWDGSKPLLEATCLMRKEPDDIYEEAKRITEKHKSMGRITIDKEEADKFSRELAIQLVDKTKGEAAIRIRKPAQEGKGLEAYRSMHRWFVENHRSAENGKNNQGNEAGSRTKRRSGGKSH